MAENGDGGAAPFLAFLVGGLIVAAVVLGFFAYTGHQNNAANVPSHLTLNVKPSLRHP